MSEAPRPRLWLLLVPLISSAAVLLSIYTLLTYISEILP